MLFRLSWIGAILERELEAETSAKALTDRGLTVDAVEADGADATLDVDIPANRPDCLGHLGLARELAAAHGWPLPRPEKAEAAPGLEVEIEIREPEACGRFTARIVRGVKIGPSPDWLVSRLEACGLRSINNVVDISNYVMLETGNPTHYFDLARLPAPRLIVRKASEGEGFAPLDGEPIELSAEDVVVADETGAAGLGGVIGGTRTGITDETTDVLIESAWFEPLGVRRRAKRHGFHTDASHRFERGVDPEGPLMVQAMTVRLLEELAGGTAESGMIDHFPARAERPTVELDHDAVDRLLGYRPSDDEISAALGALGLRPESITAGRSRVTVPSWRVDLVHEADLVEEVARHLGYDRIPEDDASILVLPATFHEDPETYRLEQLAERARDLLSGRGFHEAYGYAMIGPDDDAGFSLEDSTAMALANPMSETMGTLRRSLLPGLVAALDRNLRRGVPDVRLFEVGRSFIDRGRELPDEPLCVGVVWSGAARPRHWSEAARELGWADVAGLGEALIRDLVPGIAPTVTDAAPAALHPGRSLGWVADGHRLGSAGMLHPARQRELSQPTAALEIDLSALARCAAARPTYQRLSRLGAASRDLAVVIPARVPYADVRAALEAVEAPAPVTFEVVDRYVGAPLADDEASVTIRASLRPFEKALTDEVIETYREALIVALGERLGLSVRG